MLDELDGRRIAVVIPCFKVREHIERVIGAIGPEVSAIYCVDDACPEDSGIFISANCHDPRVRVLRHEVNQGVGGAVISGYKAAVLDGAEVLVKIDGDGQMDPALLPLFVRPILRGEADYTKGNRFWDLTHVRRMPAVRRFGNLALSFLSKLSAGYWDIFDPTNGYTAIDARVASRLPLDRLSRRYFFETDVLFRLSLLRAVVADVPMDAVYGDEKSNLRVSSVLPEFALKHLRNFTKRIAYRYFLRDLSFASVELFAGLGLGAFALAFGGYHWWMSALSNEQTPLGTIMIAAISAMSSLQFLLAFVAFDVASVPRSPLHRMLPPVPGRGRYEN